MILTHSQARARFQSRPAQATWDKLVDDGYHAQHLRRDGIVFGNARDGNAGYISWLGRVTWSPYLNR